MSYPAIRTYLQKRKARKIIKKIEMDLLEMQRKCDSIFFLSNKLMNISHYVPISLSKKIFEKCEADRNYIAHNRPFYITYGIQRRYLRHVPCISCLPQFENMIQKYKAIQKEFHIQYEIITSSIFEIGESSRRYYDKVQRFFSEISELRQGYISEAIKIKFIARNRETYLFYRLVDATGIEDPLILRFLSVMNNFDKNVVLWNREYVQRNFVISISNNLVY
jgi:hypothetical protein